MPKLAFDAAGLARLGIHFSDGVGNPRLMEFLDDSEVAFDAQPTLITVGNSGIPAFLSTFVSPEVIKVLVAPMKAADILGEAQKGDWTTTSAMFPMVEYTGQTSSYGDYSENGTADANLNFPQRQPYHYQTFTQWGQKELAYAGNAKIDWASQKTIASALILNKYQNATYFLGVAGLQNYGLLNDPSLSAPLTPTATWSSATAAQIYLDVTRLFKQLQTQLVGKIQTDSPMVLAMSPTNSVNLNAVVATYMTVNVYDQIKKNFPNIRFEFAPEYSTTGGELVQLIADSVEGQKTGVCAYTEKMRAHNVVLGTSSFKQKKSQGSYGTILYLPAAIAQMLG